MNARPEIRYRPCHCSILNCEVWAVLAAQANQHWKIVNCLDKDKRCFQKHCAFTQCGGRWPFDSLDHICAK